MGQGGSAVKNLGSAAQTGDNASVGIWIAIAVISLPETIWGCNNKIIKVSAVQE